MRTRPSLRDFVNEEEEEGDSKPTKGVVLVLCDEDCDFARPVCAALLRDGHRVVLLAHVRDDVNDLHARRAFNDDAIRRAIASSAAAQSIPPRHQRRPNRSRHGEAPRRSVTKRRGQARRPLRRGRPRVAGPGVRRQVLRSRRRRQLAVHRGQHRVRPRSRRPPTRSRVRRAHRRGTRRETPRVVPPHRRRAGARRQVGKRPEADRVPVRTPVARQRSGGSRRRRDRRLPRRRGQRRSGGASGVPRLRVRVRVCVGDAEPRGRQRPVLRRERRGPAAGRSVSVRLGQFVRSARRRSASSPTPSRRCWR